MTENFIDITKINTQYSCLKIQNKKIERDLLTSIVEKDISDPLLGIWDDQFILLDGFKRYRCAVKLHITHLPYKELAKDQAMAMINVLRSSNSKSLHILEQAKFIRHLKNSCYMSSSDLAKLLDRSVNWVSTRLNLLKELSPLLEEKIFSGQFPVWNAMGILQQCKRSKIATDSDIDKFIQSVSSRGLSVRDIDLLAHGYFKGGPEVRAQIESGNLSWPLNRLKDDQRNSADLTDSEKRVLKDLEILQKYSSRLVLKLPQFRGSNDFISSATLLAEGILGKQKNLEKILQNFLQESSGD